MNIKNLMVRLNQVSKQSVGKVMYSLFVMMIFEIILSTLLIYIQNKTGVRFGIAAFILPGEISLLFQYGLAVMLLRMVRGEYVTLGYIFYGFKNLRQSLPVCITISFFLGIIVFSANFITDSAVALISLVLSIFLLLPFVFVFNFRYDGKEEMFLIPFIKSAKLIFSNGNYFRLIGLSIRAGGRYLVTAIIIALIINLFASRLSTETSVVKFILDFIFFINAYTAAIRIFFSPHVMYVEANSNNQKEEEEC